ncbi:PREDICTED: paramyosin [Brassica oleracea var. oleracea]|uniref:C2 NT-type domain-containing protein n=1 Tax=Brassica oleracea var. oleracea TaxID=109376 RepID=A0A0D3C0E3_BRAOL|nr:PREDICTED: paramyosin [Brassica oleracea var. oleracea]
MFKSGRWRSEKNKIKIVFKLQFHATLVSELKGEGLTISLVPGDVGKPTGKTEKAVVLDGYCRWESPVYETVKFVQDVKTCKVNQRIYHLILSTTGSTKSGLVGETSIDFSDYVDAIKTCNVSLPLQNSISKALLHVSIQKQLQNVDLQRVVKSSRSLDLNSQLSIEADESLKCDSLEEGPFGKGSRIAELRRRASIESDSTLSSFDSVSEVDTLGELGSRGDLIQQNQPTIMHHHHSVTNVYHEEPPVSESEWSGSSDQGISTDDSMNSSSNDTIPPRDTTRTTSSDGEVDKLKAELVALARRADFSELELQSLRKQIVKETKRSQDLLREVTTLKQERDSKVRNKLQCEGKDTQVLLEELDYEKDLNSSLRIQLQKTKESNTELILAVQDLEAMLGQRRKNNTEEPRRRSCTSETDEDEDQKALDEIVKGHMDAKEAHVLERRITDLYNEIEIHKRDKDDLEIQVEQLALDYEILKQENHDISYKLEQSQVHEQLKMQYECSPSIVNVNELENHIEGLEAKLKMQSEDFSKSLSRIKELETQMEEELEKQALVLEADIEAVTRAKVEQEKRAIEAEEALRKSRWKNASVAGKIQDEFKRISEQMSSTLAANEKMTKKAMRETRDLRMQKRQLEELLMNAKDELRENKVEYEAKLSEMERMLGGLVEKSKNLESEKRRQEDVNADLTQVITRLKDEIEILRLEAEASLQLWNIEKDELSSMIVSMKKESESLAEELQRIKDEKEVVVTLLESELETARGECGDLQHSLSKNESEIEKHISNKERIILLEEHIKLKENALEAFSKMFIEKEKELNSRIEELETELNKRSLNSLETGESLHGPEAAIALQSRKVLSSNKSDVLEDLVNEVASLKEQNGDMEMELKEMQERYSEISVRFAEVEGERQRLVMTVRNLKNAKRS